MNLTKAINVQGIKILLQLQQEQKSQVLEDSGPCWDKYRSRNTAKGPHPTNLSQHRMEGYSAQFL